MNKNLKNILKTSTMLAGLALSAMEAGAVPTLRTTTGDADTATGGGMGGAWVTGDEIVFNGQHNLAVNSATTIAAIDLSNEDQSTKTITVSEDASIGSIALDGVNPGTPGRAMKLTVNDGKTLTLTGTASSAGGGVAAKNYSGLGAVTLGSGGAGGADAKLVITTDGAAGTPPTLVKFDNAVIDGLNDGEGILAVSGDYNQFANPIGSTHYLKEITISGAQNIFDNVVKAVTVEVSGADTMATGGINADNINITGGSLESGTDIADKTGAAPAKINITNSASLIMQAAAGIQGGVWSTDASGEVTFQGGNTVTGKVGYDNAGNAKGLASVTVTGGNGSTVTFNDNVFAARINMKGDGTDVGAISLATGKNIMADIFNTSGNNNEGTIVFEGAGTVTGTIGATGAALQEIKIANNTVNLDGDVFVSTINLTDAGGASKIILGDGFTITGDVDNTSGTDAKGKIEFTGVGTITGKIGETRRLEEIKTADSKKATFGDATQVINSIGINTNDLKIGSGGAEFNSNLVTITTGTVDLISDGATITLNKSKITGALNNSAGKLNTAIIVGGGDTSEITSKVGETNPIALATINDGRLKLSRGGENKISNVILNHSNAVLELGTNDNWKLTGAIKTATAGQGKIVISGSSAAAGSGITSIGEQSKNIAEISFTGDKTFVYSGADFYVDKVTTTNNNRGTLAITTNADTTITSSIGTLDPTLNGVINAYGVNSKFPKAVTVGNATAHNYSFSGDFIGSSVGFAAGAHTDTVLKIGHANIQVITSSDGNAAAIVNKNGGTPAGTVSVVDNAIIIGDIGSGGGNDRILKLTFDTANTGLALAKLNNTTVALNVATEIAFNQTGTELGFMTIADQTISTPVKVAQDGYGIIEVAAGSVTASGGKLSLTPAGRYTNTLTFASTVGNKTTGLALAAIDVQDGKVAFAEDANVKEISAKEVKLQAAGKMLTVGTIGHSDSLKGDDAMVTFSAAHAIKADKVKGSVTFGVDLAGPDVAVIQEITRDAIVGNQATVDGAKVKIIGDDIKFQHADGRISILDGGSVGDGVWADNGGTRSGHLKILGSAILGAEPGDNNAKIENIKTITTAGGAGKVLTINTHTIDASDLIQDATTLQLMTGTRLTGTYHPTNSTLNIGKYHFTASGQTTVGTALNMDIIYDGKNVDNTQYFAADLSANGGVDVTGGALALKVDSISFAPAGTKVQFVKAGGTNLTNKFTITDKLSIIQWTANNDGSATFVRDDKQLNVKAAGGAIFTDAQVQANPILQNLVNEKGGDDFVDLVAHVQADSAGSDYAVYKDLLARTGAADQIASSTFEALNAYRQSSQANITEQALSSAIDALKVRLASADDTVGVAAGDKVASTERGLWARAIGGMATQKSRKGTAGFKTRSLGGLVGVDTMVNDNASLGFALGNNVTNVKHKDTLSGGKTKANSWIFGIYGNYHLTDNWFVRGAGVVTQTAMDSKQPRVITAAGATATARAKYDVTNFGLEAAIGYGIKLNDSSMLTPTLGVRLNHTNDIEYQETGNSLQNHKVTQKAMNTASLIADIRAVTKVEMENGTSLAPFAHVGGSYGLGSKTPKGTFVHEGVPGLVNTYVGTKPARWMTTLGVGVDASTDVFEYGAGYNANVSQKYVSHEGSLRFKVNF